jgi:hypothetical protein
MQNRLVTTEGNAIRVALAGRLRRARALPSLAALLLLVALSVISISGCGGSSGPSGTYGATITNAREGEGFLVNGLWTVTFGKGGSYTIIKGSPQSSHLKLATGPGSYYRGTTFAITPIPATACGPPPGTGTYHMQLSGDKLTFVKITDPCKTRSEILTRTFTKGSRSAFERRESEAFLKLLKERQEQRQKERRERRPPATHTG